MSWRDYMAKYPRAILEDEKGLTVLAIIERTGLATEGEIAERSGLDGRQVSRVLIDLKVNGLVDHGTEYVKLTNKGKFIVDRCGLDEPTREDFLDEIQAETGDFRNQLKVTIMIYRDSAYSLYQNLLASVRTWRKLSSVVAPIPDKRHSPNVEMSCMHYLLHRDLKHWWKYDEPLVLLLAGESGMGKSTFVKDLVKKGLPSIHSKSQLAASIEKTIEHLSKSAAIVEEEAKVDESKRDPTLEFFLIFNKFQAMSEPDLWFDEWIEIRDNVSKQLQARGSSRESKGRQLAGFRAKLLEVLEEHGFVNENIKYENLSFGPRWLPEGSAGKLPDFFLEHMMGSFSVAELAHLVGIAEPLAEEILLSLSRKAQELLRKSNRS